MPRESFPDLRSLSMVLRSFSSPVSMVLGQGGTVGWRLEEACLGSRRCGFWCLFVRYWSW
jgi:hypothetical protein